MIDLLSNSSGTARPRTVLRSCDAEEVTGNFSLTSRHYGISYYCKWHRRYQEVGLEGLRDGSGALRHSPNATEGDIEGKILPLREHCHFRSMKIRMR
ncbi:hypothetical protein ACFQ78_39945 [Streptomyces sp. NPDC056519]|uniref:hypothetical protein n=1 Tax=Streptomyces sp. NPDC056519 TaxID=3345849 RepID=UPI0036C6B86D